MDAILSTILLHIEDDLKHERTIDVPAVAEKVHQDFPYLSLHDLRGRVFRAVAMQGGEFIWDPSDRQESSQQETLKTLLEDIKSDSPSS